MQPLFNLWCIFCILNIFWIASGWNGTESLNGFKPSEQGSGGTQKLRLRLKYNIALHAQVAPDPKQVVGSVITTDGLLSALSKRSDVGIVRIFYPFRYQKLFDTQWDVVIIEGWFLLIDDFIQIVRSHSARTIILFYCLDSSYPGLNDIRAFDVDGYLTNSRSVLEDLQHIAPTIYLPLAADPVLMSPSANKNPSALKSHPVFVGAGGHMMEYKPDLLAKILAALPFGLHLYGMGWDIMPQADIRAAHMGVLPRWDLAAVYAGAQCVLGSTIDTQRLEGMVNNRVFEAMACGAVLLTDRFPAAEEVTEGAVLFANTAEEVISQLRWVHEHPAESAALGRRARALVLQKHTWEHRAVQIMSFVGDLAARQAVQSRCCTRSNCPSMAWVVSAHVANHPDYSSVVRTQVYAMLCHQYRITEFSQEQFAALDEDHLGYESIFVVITPFDALHDQINRAGMLQTRRRVKGFARGFGRQQKWSAYMMGWDSELARAAAPTAVQSVAHFDVLFFRSNIEMAYFKERFHRISGEEICMDGLRCEHAFGFDHALSQMSKSEGPSKPAAAYTAGWFQYHSGPEEGTDPLMATQDVPLHVRAANVPTHEPMAVVVCFERFPQLCTIAARRALTQADGVNDLDYHLLLVGGTWDAWIATPGVVSAAEPGVESEHGPRNVHRVTHVPNGGSAWSAAALFGAAKFIYLMHGSGSQNDPMHTVNDVTWPLVLAAQSGVSTPPTLRLAALNEHLVRLARDDVSLWDGEHLKKSIARAISKM